MVYMVYNQAPFALITKAGSAIKTLKDLEGKTLGSPAGAAALGPASNAVSRSQSAVGEPVPGPTPSKPQ